METRDCRERSILAVSCSVMPGLVPGIHARLSELNDVVGRDKPGHDDMKTWRNVCAPPTWCCAPRRPAERKRAAEVPTSRLLDRRRHLGDRHQGARDLIEELIGILLLGQRLRQQRDDGAVAEL